MIVTIAKLDDVRAVLRELISQKPKTYDAFAFTDPLPIQLPVNFNVVISEYRALGDAQSELGVLAEGAKKNTRAATESPLTDETHRALQRITLARWFVRRESSSNFVWNSVPCSVTGNTALTRAEVAHIKEFTAFVKRQKTASQKRLLAWVM